MGELSVGRQVLEGAELAPGHTETLRQLRLRPSTHREPLPHHITHHVPERPFKLDEKKVRSKPPIITGEEQRVDIEHLRPLLHNSLQGLVQF